MERLKRSLVRLVCASLLSPSAPTLAQTTPPTPPASRQTANHAPARPAYQPGQLRGDERILHALNRFTFGPRPGDLEAVRAMGLEQWFAQQLHPASLDESDLDARLAVFPAMQWNPQDLLYRLPSNAVLRQVMDGKAPMPQGPAIHAIYADQIARIQFKKQEKQENDLKKQQAASIPAGAMAADSGMSAPSMSADAGKPPAQPAPGALAEANQINPGQMNMAAAQSELPAFDPAETARILALPAQQRVAVMARMDQPTFDNFRRSLKGPQRNALIADLAPAQKEMVAALENPQKLVIDELASQRLIRDIYSSAQLQEVMTDFWLNHFNVFLHKNEETPYYLVSFERDVIRPHALGKFEDLLELTAHSPAMLLYLDNSSSTGPDSPTAERNKEREARNPNNKKKAPQGLNENYARELMELHTLGVNGGYTQADVTQVARVLTGWTVERPQRGGGFMFDETRHEPGTKKVLGKKIKEHGELEGRELLHMLASNPATAQFLSRKLAVRFVGDEPPQALVDRMAKSYLSSGGDISVVLTTLFHSPEFWSNTAYRAKVKTPIEYVVSAVRAGNGSADNLQPLINNLREMGMPLYGSVPPTGYNWQSSTWVSSGALVDRMNFALTLAANRLPGVALSWTPPQQQEEGPRPASLVYTQASDTGPDPLSGPEGAERRLESFLVPGGVSETTRAAVLQQFEAQSAQNGAPGMLLPAAGQPMNAAQTVRQDQLLAGLLLGSPEFQRR